MSVRLYAAPSPDPAITFAGEHRFGEQLANFGHQFLIGVYLRTPLLRSTWLLFPLASGIEAGSRQIPDRDHSRRRMTAPLPAEG